MHVSLIPTSRSAAILSLVMMAAPDTASLAQGTLPPGTGQPIELPQPLPPRPEHRTTPLPPSIDSPAAGVSRGGAAGTGPTLVWNQGGLIPIMRGSAPNAQHFVVCLAPAPAPACAWPGTFRAAVSAIPRVAWADPRLGATSPGRYTYTYQVPAPWANYLDRNLVLTVGACAAQTQASCSFSQPRNLYWSTRNLVATDLHSATQSGSNGTDWTFVVTVNATNEGIGSVDPFQVRTVIREALQDPRYDCLTDVNSPLVNATDLAIRRDASEVQIGSLPRDAAGRRIGTDVVGIWRDGLFMLEQTGPGVGLSPGAVDQVVAQFIATEPWSAGPASPKRFVVSTRLDSGMTVREWHEGDNARAKCPGRAIFQ